MSASSVSSVSTLFVSFLSFHLGWSHIIWKDGLFEGFDQLQRGHHRDGICHRLTIVSIYRRHPLGCYRRRAVHLSVSTLVVTHRPEPRRGSLHLYKYTCSVSGDVILTRIRRLRMTLTMSTWRMTIHRSPWSFRPHLWLRVPFTRSDDILYTWYEWCICTFHLADFSICAGEMFMNDGNCEPLSWLYEKPHILAWASVSCTLINIFSMLRFPWTIFLCAK